MADGDELDSAYLQPNQIGSDGWSHKFYRSKDRDYDGLASSSSTALPTPSGSRSQTPLGFASHVTTPSGSALKVARRMSDGSRPFSAVDMVPKPPSVARPSSAHKRPSTARDCIALQQGEIKEPNADFTLWHLQSHQQQYLGFMNCQNVMLEEQNSDRGDGNAYFFHQLKQNTMRYERLLAEQKMQHDKELEAYRAQFEESSREEILREEMRWIGVSQKYMEGMRRRLSNVGTRMAALRRAALLRSAMAAWHALMKGAAMREEQTRAECESRFERVTAVVGHLVETVQNLETSEKAARQAGWHAYESGWQAAMVCQKSFTCWREAIVTQDRDRMAQVVEGLQAQVVALQLALEQAAPESHHINNDG